jgi:hypothetical protein
VTSPAPVSLVLAIMALRAPRSRLIDLRDRAIGREVYAMAVALKEHFKS